MSKLFKLDYTDLGKALLVFFIASVLGSVNEIISENRLPQLSELQNILIISLKATGAYLVKNIFTNSKGKFLKKEIS